MGTAVTALEARLKAIQKGGARPLTDKEALVLRLNAQYPQDVGVLSAFFLNLVKLHAGQVRAYPNPHHIMYFSASRLQDLFIVRVCCALTANCIASVCLICGVKSK